MAWASGYPIVCLACQQPGGLTTIVESYDRHDHVVVGKVVCSRCGGHGLYSRRPLKGEDMAHDVENITDERAARRFHQIRHQEQRIAKLDKRIFDAKTKLGTLKEERDGVVAALLAAARDEGDLPLFDLE